MPFHHHTDEDLRAAYRGYQGQNPSTARCIFVGFDANFTPGDNWEQMKPIHLDYLNRGPDWCIENNRHHSLAPAEGAEDLRDYHNVLASLFRRCTGLGVPRTDILRGISFVDLLGKPTTGNRREDRPLYRQLLREDANQDHLRTLHHWLEENTGACLVIPRWVLIELLSVAPDDGVIMTDVRCRRTLIVRHFPYFYGKRRDFKSKSLDLLAEKIVSLAALTLPRLRTSGGRSAPSKGSRES